MRHKTNAYTNFYQEKNLFSKIMVTFRTLSILNPMMNIQMPVEIFYTRYPWYYFFIVQEEDKISNPWLCTCDEYMFFSGINSYKTSIFSYSIYYAKPG